MKKRTLKQKQGTLQMMFTKWFKKDLKRRLAEPSEIVIIQKNKN